MKKIQKFKKFLFENPSLIYKLACEGMANFMLFCLPHLFKYQFGIFQLCMIHDTESKERHIVCPTFPDSYAEEIFMYSYVLWSILGVNKFTNCVIVCGTREKAKEVYEKFKNEFLQNRELRKFNHKVTDASCDGWNIFVPGFNARISILSFPILPSRIRHKRRSPDIVICCDLEDSLAGTSVITAWMENQLYDNRHFYQKTVVFGTVKGKDNIFESIRLQGVADKKKRFDVLLTPCPLFGDEKECFWEKRYSKKEIRKMLENWDDKSWQQKYLLHTYEVFKVPKKYFHKDGSCKIQEYKESLKSQKDFSLDLIFHKVAEMRQAENYSILGGRFSYYGTGVVIKYEADEKD